MASYSIRDSFGRFARLVGGIPEERPPPIRDALGHYVSRPIEPPPALPDIPFVDTRSRRERDWDDFVDRAVDALDLPSDKPDINDFLSDYEREWLGLWDIAPVEDMTYGQIMAMIDGVFDALETDDWDQIWEEMSDDFWDWFREHYKEQ